MRATCTWGEGPDVLLLLEGTSCVLHEPPIIKHYVHGTVSQGSIDLTVAQAESLARQLLCAVAQCKNLDEMADEVNTVSSEDAPKFSKSEMLLGFLKIFRSKRKSEVQDSKLSELELKCNSYCGDPKLQSRKFTDSQRLAIHAIDPEATFSDDGSIVSSSITYTQLLDIVDANSEY